YSEGSRLAWYRGSPQGTRPGASRDFAGYGCGTAKPGRNEPARARCCTQGTADHDGAGGQHGRPKASLGCSSGGPAPGTRPCRASAGLGFGKELGRLRLASEKEQAIRTALACGQL